MITLENNSFMITTSPQRYHSLPNSNKHSPSGRHLYKEKHLRTESYEDYESLSSVAKKYLYFHEQRKQPQELKKLSFPYNPLNLCYFENKFGSKKDTTQRNRHDFNSNRSIRKFLDSKLNTEPSETKAITNNSKEVLIGKRIIELKTNEEEDSSSIFLTKEKTKQKNASISKESTKISGNEEKCGKVSKFPIVLKIKSKKAYFLSRFKNKTAKEEYTKEINTIHLKDQMEEDENPFEMKFRSKTEDNINLINLMREESRKGSVIKNNKAIFNTIREDTVEPWEIHNQFMESSLRFEENY